MSDRYQSAAVRSNVFWMVIAALLFGYFGFGLSWDHRYTNETPPQLLIMVAVLMWSLRGGCIAFTAAALLAMIGTPVALLLYSLAGLITAVAFLAVAYWDWNTPQYYSGIPPFLLLIFALLNGYGSVQGLRDWRHLQARRGSDEQRFMAP